MPYRLDMPDRYPTLTPDSSRIKMELTIRLPILISGETGKTYPPLLRSLFVAFVHANTPI
jgi:hypothetical protein